MRNLQTIYRSVLALAAALLFAAAPAAAQTLFKCTAADGRVTFQQQACASTQGHGQAVNVQPANVVEGDPAGDAGVRASAARNAAVRSATARGQLVYGMSTQELQQVMGAPSVVNTDEFNGRVRQQHVYRSADGATRYVYTQDGQVTGVQVRPGVAPTPRPGCRQASEINSARFELSSRTRTPEEKARIQARVDAMERNRC